MQIVSQEISSSNTSMENSHNPPKSEAAASEASDNHNNKKPSTSRRPRVREVSSRFMSPIVSSSSSGDLHLPSSSSSASSKCPPSVPKHHHQHEGQQIRQQLHQRSQSVIPRRHPPPSPVRESSESEPLCSSNGNSVVRSLDTPLVGFHPSKSGMQMKRIAKQLLKENGDPLLDSSRPPPDTVNLKAAATAKLPARNGKRTDTPMAFFGLDRSTPRSVFSTHNLPRSTSFRVASAASTAAAKLVQSSGMGAKRNAVQSNGSIHGNPASAESSDNDDGTLDFSNENSTSSDCSSSDLCTVSCHGGICDSPPIPPQTSKIRPISEFRSSMPEADMLPAMSARMLGEGNSSETIANGETCRISASPCYRSLNSALLSCQQAFSPTKSVCRSSVVNKSYSGSTKPGAVCLPPHPSTVKSGMETKKAKRASCHQEDVHSLRTLYNRYLQWRFTNAQAEAAMNAQRAEAERSLSSVTAQISEMRDSVMRTRIELQQLKKIERLYTSLNAQSPYLEEWAVLEEDYSRSLSGAAKALHDASVRLPINGNVRADIRELSKALNSATNVLEAISPYVQSILPKAEGMDHVISELAGVVGRERALIEECGELLSKAHILQVEECSLRGQLIQLKRCCSTQPKEV